MAEPTKAQILEELEELKRAYRLSEKRLADTEERLEQAEERTREVARRGEGWLVRTPDAAFSGTRYGIRFQNGQTFILFSQVVEAFKVEPESDGALKKFLLNQFPSPLYTAQDRENQYNAIRKREAMPSSQRAVEALANDFGYQVKWYGADDLVRLNEDIAVHAQQAAALIASRDADRANLDQITDPARLQPVR